MGVRFVGAFAFCEAHAVQTAMSAAALTTRDFVCMGISGKKNTWIGIVPSL